MTEIMIIPLNKNTIIPKKSTIHACCYDVYVNSLSYDLQKHLMTVGLGFSVKMPSNYKMVLVPRSSLTNYAWILQNSPGQGDADYNNEYLFKFRAIPSEIRKKITPLPVSISPSISPSNSQLNLIPTPSQYELVYDEFPYKIGDRCGQIYFEKVRTPNIIIKPIEEVVIRQGGYGSTGTK